MVFVPSSPSCLCFPALPPFFFKDSYIFQSSIRLFMWSLSILFRQCSYPVISHEDAQEFQVHHPPFFLLLRWIQCKLSVLIISFSLFHMLSRLEVLTEDSLNLSLLAIELFRSAEDISQDLCFHSQSIQDISRLLSHSSHLIQSVQSPFQVIISRVLSLQWALTHRSFPRILPDSSYSPGVILKSSKVWRKNELSSVKCLSPRSFISFHRCLYF